MFLRLNAAQLAGLPEDDGESEWVTAKLSYRVVPEARQLLVFSDRVEVLSPPEVREELARAAASVTDLYQRVSERAEKNTRSEGSL